ncbi:MAG: zeta toxin family protein [Paludibacteraceae bacterium]|nr:zeta toxin family protein [Paludibacteraceae bacterium]
MLAQKVDFAIETTLATRSYVQLVKRAQSIGYKVHLLFFCLESPEQAIQRVAQRVEQGGHGIPEDVIRRRFKKGLSNLVHLYLPICNSMYVFDNTQGKLSCPELCQLCQLCHVIFFFLLPTQLAKLWREEPRQLCALCRHAASGSTICRRRTLVVRYIFLNGSLSIIGGKEGKNAYQKECTCGALFLVVTISHNFLLRSLVGFAVGDGTLDVISNRRCHKQ